MKKFSNEEKMEVLVEKMKREGATVYDINCIREFEFGKIYTFDKIISVLFRHRVNQYNFMVYFTGCTQLTLREELITDDLIMKYISGHKYLSQVLYNKYNVKELVSIDKILGEHIYINCIKRNNNFVERKTINLKSLLDNLEKYDNKEDMMFMERIERQTRTSSILDKSSEESLRKLYDTYGIDFIVNTIDEEFHICNIDDSLYMSWRCYCNSLNISHIDEVLNFDLYSQELIDCDLITKVENKTAFTEKNNLHTYRFNVQYLVSVINKKLRGDNVMQNKTVVGTVKNNTKIMKDVFDKVVKENIQIISPEEALKKQCEVYGFNNVVNFITKTLECAVSTGDLDIRFYEGWKYRIKHSPINDVTDIITFRVYIKGDIYISNLIEIDDANPFMELYSLKFNIWYLVQIISKEFEEQQFKINDISDKSTPNVVEQIITYMLFNSLSGYRFSSHKYNLNDYDIDKLKKLGFEVEKSYNSIGTGYIVKKKNNM